MLFRSKKMWAEGQSASQIAKELGGVTRNAVIGKVHRLGLSNRVGGGGVAEGEDDAAVTAKAEPTARPAEPLRGAEPAPRVVPDRPTPSASITPIPMRKAIIPAGQPLPPQPSANEISPEALASVQIGRAHV